MRREYIFDRFILGLCYLGLLVCSPIIAILLELRNASSGLGLYITLLVNGGVILYEYICLYNEQYVSKTVWFERLAGIVSIAAMITYAIICLLLYNGNSEHAYGFVDYVVCALWLVPLINTLIEIIRLLKKEYKLQTSYPDDMDDFIVKSAKKV